MKKPLNQMANVAAVIVSIILGCMIAGLGVTFMVFLAMFAMAAAGLALIVALFDGRAFARWSRG